MRTVVLLGRAHGALLRGANWAKGQLGDGNTSYGSATPVTVQGLSNVIALAAGRKHSCALLGNGLVQCWGGNGRGQLGDGAAADSWPCRWGRSAASPWRPSVWAATTPVPWSVSARCAARGANDQGQLGDNTRMDRNTAVTLAAPNNAVAIAGGGLHTCALRSDGSLSCWGNGEGGALGNGTWDDALARPRCPACSAWRDLPPVATRAASACPMAASSALAATVGQLGNGSTNSSNVPLAVSGAHDVQALTTDGGHVCAQRSNGALWCWGSNTHGELGNGFAHSLPHPVPVTMPNIAAAGRWGIACVQRGPRPGAVLGRQRLRSAR